MGGVDQDESSSFPENSVFIFQTAGEVTGCQEAGFPEFPAYEFVYVFHGPSSRKVNGKELVLHTGDVALLSPGVCSPSASADGTESVCWHFFFEKCFFDGLCKDFNAALYEEVSLQSTVKVVHLNEIQANMLKYYGEVCSRSGRLEKSLSQSLPAALLNNLLLLFMPRISDKKMVPEYIVAIITHIKTHMAFKMAYHELYDLAYHSEEQVCRMFKRCTGKTITAYMNEQKLEYAAALLTDSEQSVHEILEEVNISSHTYFNAMFKGKYGLCPSEYRKKMKYS